MIFVYIIEATFVHFFGEDQLVDTQSGSDAIELNNFEIDTARYQLNNEYRAFGVGTNFAPHSNNVSFSEQQINLYEQQIEKVENHQLLNLIN